MVGPALLAIPARLVGRVAYCEADVNNNNIIIHASCKEPVPEFKWHILWEFVKPQLFALIGAVVVKTRSLSSYLRSHYYSTPFPC